MGLKIPFYHGALKPGGGLLALAIVYFGYQFGCCLLPLVALTLLYMAFSYLYWTPYDPKALCPKDFHVPDAKRVTKPGTDYNAMPTEEKFLVVGAGFVGLGMMGGLSRHGIPFECVESDVAVGGNWRHGVYETVHIISSRLTTEFKDFPMDEAAGDFPSARSMANYFEEYTRHFGFDKYIRFKTKVVNVEPISKTSKFMVETETTDDNGRVTTKKAIYKGVILSIGHHWNMRWPKYPGIDAFQGDLIHSKQYKNYQQIKDKRVLVVGGGNSACDVSVECARFSTKAHHSMRRGYWFFPRTFAGLPVVELTKPWVPTFIGRFVWKFLAKIVYGDYTRYGLRTPDHDPLDHHPTINSELLNFIRLGDIVPQVDIESFTGGKTVKFVDGRTEDYDVVVCCTGYTYSMPMIDRFVPYVQGIPRLFGGAYTPYKNLIAAVGYQVRYGAGPLINLFSESTCEMIKTQENLKVPVGIFFWGMKGEETIPKKSKHSSDVLECPYNATSKMLGLINGASSFPTVQKFAQKMGKKFVVPQEWIDKAPKEFVESWGAEGLIAQK